METIKNEFWSAVIGTDDKIRSVHQTPEEAEATLHKSMYAGKVERVRVTIDRIKTS